MGQDIFADMTKDQHKIVSKIAERAHKMFKAAGKPRDYISIEMDIEAAQKTCPMDLEKLLEFPEYDFKHDVFGIYRHLDRNTGELMNCFCPRSALPDDESPFHYEYHVELQLTHAPNNVNNIIIDLESNIDSDVRNFEEQIAKEIFETEIAKGFEWEIIAVRSISGRFLISKETVTGGNAGSHG